jgi:hypothetical protein
LRHIASPTRAKYFNKVSRVEKERLYYELIPHSSRFGRKFNLHMIKKLISYQLTQVVSGIRTGDARIQCIINRA